MTRVTDEMARLKNTHLMNWLEQGYEHCQHGSKDWCQGHLDSARLYIEALEAALTASPNPAEEVEPVAWLVETFADNGKECLNSQFVIIPSVAAQFNKPYHRVTPLYTHPPAPKRLEEAMSFTVDDLAQEIRRVDGNNSLGAGALAEALAPFIANRRARAFIKEGGSHE